MRPLLLALFISLFASYSSDAQWVNQNVPLPYSGNLLDIEAVNADVAWATVRKNTSGGNTEDPGDFARTTDGGQTWEFKSVNYEEAFYTSNIWPLSADECYISGFYAANSSGGIVLKTTDGGDNWVKVSTPEMFADPGSFCNLVYFSDAAHGITVGDQIGEGADARYEMWVTDDGAQTWTQVPVENIPAAASAQEVLIINIFAAVGSHIWLAGMWGNIYHSSDNGLTWSKSVTGFPAKGSGSGRRDISGIAFSDEMHGMVFQKNTGGDLIRVTNDGGLTWSPANPTGNFYSNDIEGVPGTSIFVSVGTNNSAQQGSSYSPDMGNTWIDLNPSGSFTCADFVSNTSGFAGQTTSATAFGGAWKFNGALNDALYACGDDEISPGVIHVSSPVICFDSTLVFTVDNVFIPMSGAGYGLCGLISQTDISGATDLTGLVYSATPGIKVIAPNGSAQYTFVNYGVLPTPATYYFTPLVFGNTAWSGNQSFFNLNLDPGCSYVGQSVPVYMLSSDMDCVMSGVDELSEASLELMQLYPVPAQEKLYLELNSHSQQSAHLVITDIMGREVFREMFALTSGINRIELGLEKFRQGLYIATVESGNVRSTMRFVKG